MERNLHSPVDMVRKHLILLVVLFSLPAFGVQASTAMAPRQLLIAVGVLAATLALLVGGLKLLWEIPLVVARRLSRLGAQTQPCGEQHSLLATSGQGKSEEE